MAICAHSFRWPLVRLYAACALCCVTAWAGASELSDERAQTAEPLSGLHDLGDGISELTMRAVGMLGVEYKWGGNDPESGLDCSGLVRYLFKDVWDMELPRTSEEMSRVGKRVALRDLQPGDLVFYNTMRRRFSHVGIYLGENKFIHAPSSGGQVRIESMDVSYWKKRFNGARRIAETEPQ